jgi:hypothetical protein
LYERQPVVRLSPLANVDEALAFVALKMVVESPPAKVEVPVPVTAKFVVVALVNSELPVSVVEAMTAEANAFN